jgi:hypothetical protein
LLAVVCNIVGRRSHSSCEYRSCQILEQLSVPVVAIVLYQIEKCCSIVTVYAVKFGPEFLVRTPFENWEHVDMATCGVVTQSCKVKTHSIFLFIENWVLCRGVILYAALCCIWVKILFFFVWILWYSVLVLLYSVCCKDIL